LNGGIFRRFAILGMAVEARGNRKEEGGGAVWDGMGRDGMGMRVDGRGREGLE
jgi:hypothetical protein